MEVGKVTKLEIPLSDAARTRIKARAKEMGFKSYAAYVRALIAADIPELKPEFTELEGWGGNRRGEKSE